MEDIEMRGGLSLRPLQEVDNLAIEADFVGSPRAIDEPALAAFASYLCALTKTRLTLTFTGHGSYTISGYGKFAELLQRYRDAFSAIALWGDFEFTFNSKEVKVTQR